MIPALALALVLTGSGCSTMYYRTAEATLHCTAFGQGTSEACAPGQMGELGPVQQTCIRCQGGPISFAEALIGAAMAWVTGGMLGW